MSAIVEFIESRLAETEGYARHFTAVDDSTEVTEFAYLAARYILWDAEAKRAILAEHEPVLCRNCAYTCDVPCCGGCGKTSPCPTLRALASIWSDHPDYDPAWGQRRAEQVVAAPRETAEESE